MKGDLIMKRYRCCGCGTIFTGWGVKETCQICGDKLEPVSEQKEELDEYIDGFLSQRPAKKKSEGDD